MIVSGDVSYDMGSIPAQSDTFFGAIDTAATFATIVFNPGENANSLAFDAASFGAAPIQTPVPPPGTLGLLALGVAGVGLVARRGKGRQARQAR